MTYYMATTLHVPFDEAIVRAEAALREEGFGVLTHIDVRQTLKNKIGVDFRPYLILGACNPELAYEALKIESHVGTMLPCNVILQRTEAGEVEIAAIDPVSSMQAIENSALLDAAAQVREKLARVIERLTAKSHAAS